MPDRASSYFTLPSNEGPSYVSYSFLTSRSITSRNKYCAMLIYTPSSPDATRGGGKKSSPRRLSGALNEKTIGTCRWSIRRGIYIRSRSVTQRRLLCPSDTLFATRSRGSRRISLPRRCVRVGLDGFASRERKIYEDVSYHYHYILRYLRIMAGTKLRYVHTHVLHNGRGKEGTIHGIPHSRRA